MAKQAPKHLADETRRWWRYVVKHWQFDEDGYKLLLVACETLDRYTQARQTLEEQGLTYIDRFGAPRARPEVAIERDSRLAFARLLGQLDLEGVEPPPAKKPMGRPTLTELQQKGKLKPL